MRCARVEAALTKWRLPSSPTSTEAKPGVKPAPCEIASTTPVPRRRSMVRRTCGGRCGHSRRRAVRPWGMVVGTALLTASSSATEGGEGQPVVGVRRPPDADLPRTCRDCADPHEGYDLLVIRFFILGLLLFLGAVTVLAASLGGWAWWILVAVVVLLGCVGVYDVLQRRHSILRNY